MTNFEKQKLLNDFIFNKIKHCKETSLLSDKEKEILHKLTKDTGAYNNDFLMLLSDELQEQKKHRRAKSYVYTYKQAQALVYCLKNLGYEVDVNVMFNQQEITDILTNFNTESDIIREFDYLFIDYIKITKKGAKKNAGYKKKTRIDI